MASTSLECRLLFFARAGLYGLLLSPLVFFHGFAHPFSSAQSYFILALSEFSFLTYIWLVWKFPHWRPRWTFFDTSFFIFVGILFVTLLVGQDLFFSFWSSMDRTTGGLMWLHLLGVYVVLRSLLRTLDDWMPFLRVSMVIALTSSFVHLLTLVGIDVIPLASGGSTFGNSTYFATYILLHVFFALIVASQTDSVRFRWFSLLSAFLLIATLLTTAANAARISLVGGLVLLAASWVILFGKKQWIRASGWLIVLLLLVSTVTVGFLVFQPESKVQETFIDLSSGARFALWDMAWQGIQEKPLLGWGLENYRLVSYRYFDSCLGSEFCGSEIWFDRVHNKILDVWIETGVIGLIAYLFIFATAVVSLWRASRASVETRKISLILFALLAAYFVQNLVALETSTILLFWVFLLGMVSSTSQTAMLDAEMPQASRKPFSLAVPVCVTLLFPVSLFFLILQPVQANMAVRSALFATESDQRKQAYDFATKISPVGIDMRRVWLADDTVKTIWQGFPKGTALPDGLLKELQNAADRLEDTLARSSGDLRARIALGFVYKTKGYFLEDEAAYKKAQSILEVGMSQSPHHPVVVRALASIYLSQEKNTEALALSGSLLDLEPPTASAYGYHLTALRLADAQESFESVAAQALERFPSLAADIQKLRMANIDTDRQALLYLFH